MIDNPTIVAVVGGGRMGAGIAQVFATLGATVVIAETNATAADAARDRVLRGLERAAEKGAYLQKRLQDLRSHEIVGDVRGLGLIGGVELVRDRATKASFDPALGAARRVCLSALEQGVIFRPLAGDVVGMSPAFVISEEQIDRMVMWPAGRRETDLPLLISRLPSRRRRNGASILFGLLSKSR